ncbi:MAG: hypothetical protein OSB09_02645 [Planctomycetota bacterium]|nr:hypothetical protein [Planctomycetota bacterium]
MIHRSELIPLMLFLVLLGAAAAVTVPLDRGLEEDGISLPISSATGVPADVLLMQQTLGAFRGWAIDALWLRALARREQGRLHESMELATWITKLQPYFPRVWNFQSWLLAFELALDSRDPEQRWSWVRESVDLLRGPGLRANPFSHEIHGQLSYLFWFKIGEFQDESAGYYQRRLCQRWRGFLGDPPAGDPLRYREVLQRISVAATEVSPSSLPWLKDATLSAGLEAALDDPEPFLRAGVGISIPGLPIDHQQEVEDMLRRSLLEGELNMSPELMARLTTYLGPVDWRTPGAHAIYWAAQGTLRSQPDGLSESLDDSNIELVLVSTNVRIGLQKLVRYGRPLLDQEGLLITSLPQPGILPSYERSLICLTAGQGIPDELLPRMLEIIAESVVTAWLQGEDSMAMQLLTRYQELAGDSPDSPPAALESQIDALVFGTLTDQDGERERRGLLVGIRGKSMVAHGGGGTPWEARRGKQLADRLERKWYGQRLPDVRRDSIISALRTPEFSAPLSVKCRIWETLGADEKLDLDDTTRSLLKIEASRSGRTPESSFPGIEKTRDRAGIGTGK